MSEIIYPVHRLLANPKIFFAIAAHIDGPDAETLKDIFYDLIESDIADAETVDEIEFAAGEVCFRHSPDEHGVIQVILDTGTAAELRPHGEYVAGITSKDELDITSTIYKRLVEAIIESRPEFAGDVVLCDPPMPSNQYLRSEDGESFNGQFHLLSDPEKTFGFSVEVIDIPNDILKATVFPN
jgi:hypothetical protein